MQIGDVAEARRDVRARAIEARRATQLRKGRAADPRDRSASSLDVDRARGRVGRQRDLILCRSALQVEGDRTTERKGVDARATLQRAKAAEGERIARRVEIGRASCRERA